MTTVTLVELQKHTAEVKEPVHRETCHALHKFDLDGRLARRIQLLKESDKMSCFRVSMSYLADSAKNAEGLLWSDETNSELFRQHTKHYGTRPTLHIALNKLLSQEEKT